MKKPRISDNNWKKGINHYTIAEYSKSLRTFLKGADLHETQRTECECEKITNFWRELKIGRNHYTIADYSKCVRTTLKRADLHESQRTDCEYEGFSNLWRLLKIGRNTTLSLNIPSHCKQPWNRRISMNHNELSANVKVSRVSDDNWK